MDSNLNSSKIKEIIQSFDLELRERPRTIYTRCPGCGEDDKLSIFKDGGSTICYRGSCSFGGPRPFVEWVMMTGELTRQQAIDRVFGKLAVPIEVKPELKLNLSDPDKKQAKTVTKEILLTEGWPLLHSYDLFVPESIEGVTYLSSRGVTADVATSYGIRYSPFMRRVIFPVVMNGSVFGWQARAIDNVHPGDRMRNNPGFQRARCVLFLDRLQPGGIVIIAEGPLDAIKFHECGGNISTMGKVISDEQLNLILSKQPKAIYLALDDDAAKEMRDIATKIQVPVFRIFVPESAVTRCRKLGKKPDFGECTMIECTEAFSDAKSFGMLSTAIHLKNPWE